MAEKELACKAKQDVSPADQPAHETQHAADLSSSCWTDPGKSADSGKDGKTDTTNGAATAVSDGKNGAPAGKNESPGVGKIATADSVIMGGATVGKSGFDGAAAGIAAKAGDDTRSTGKEAITALGFPDAKIEDLKQTAPDASTTKNPPPDTWKYDAKGNLLQAGDRVKAEYDAEGNLQKAQVDGKTYERKGSDVIESSTDSDGKPWTSTMHGVKSFTLKTSDGEFKGAFKSVDIEAKTASGDLSAGSVIWESPEHKASQDKFWHNEQARAGDLAKSTPDNPHPETWKFDAQGHLTEAGNKLKAEYDPKTGDLTYAKMGDDEWRKGPDNTVTHSHTMKDGTVSTDVTKDVRSFKLEIYGDDEHGILQGATVKTEYNKTSSSENSIPIYENDEHAAWAGGIVSGWTKEMEGAPPAPKLPEMDAAPPPPVDQQPRKPN